MSTARTDASATNTSSKRQAPKRNAHPLGRGKNSSPSSGQQGARPHQQKGASEWLEAPSVCFRRTPESGPPGLPPCSAVRGVVAVLRRHVAPFEASWLAQRRRPGTARAAAQRPCGWNRSDALRGRGSHSQNKPGQPGQPPPVKRGVDVLPATIRGARPAAGQRGPPLHRAAPSQTPGRGESQPPRLTRRSTTPQSPALHHTEP